VTATTAWLAVGLVALVAALSKGIGPAVIGERELPAPLLRVVVLLAAALVPALVVTSTLAEGGELRVGARTAGVLAAAVLLWRRAHLVVVVVGAAAVTAGLRQLGVS
jgi:branched-subunit amino acid transport protein